MAARVSLFFAAALLALASCSDVPSASRSGAFVPLSDDFGSYTFSLRGEGVEYVSLWQFEDLNNAFHVCGVVGTNGTWDAGFASQVLSKISFYANGEEVLRGGTFAMRAPSEDALAQTPLACASTGQPTPEGPIEGEIRINGRLTVF